MKVLRFTAMLLLAASAIPLAQAQDAEQVPPSAGAHHLGQAQTANAAAQVGPAIRAGLAAEIVRQIKPHWKPPTGADSDKLRTTVLVELDRSGAIVGQPRVTQTGVTAANSELAELHRECAVRAVQLGAPFKLPTEYYETWKTIVPTLYEGL